MKKIIVMNASIILLSCMGNTLHSADYTFEEKVFFDQQRDQEEAAQRAKKIIKKAQYQKKLQEEGWHCALCDKTMLPTSRKAHELSDSHIAKELENFLETPKIGSLADTDDTLSSDISDDTSLNGSDTDSETEAYGEELLQFMQAYETEEQKDIPSNTNELDELDKEILGIYSSQSKKRKRATGTENLLPNKQAKEANKEAIWISD